MKDPRVLLILKIMQCLSSEELNLTFAWEWSGPWLTHFSRSKYQTKGSEKKEAEFFYVDGNDGRKWENQIDFFS